MDAVEELREVDIDHHPVPVADVLLRFGDRRVCSTLGPESVAARMKGRLVSCSRRTWDLSGRG